MKRFTTIFALLASLLPLTAGAGVANDSDNDGIPDVIDKCTLDSRNVAASCDTDQDGYGNPCDADYDQNFAVGGTDFSSFFIPAFKGGTITRGQDMDCNGACGATDFGSYFIPKFKGALGGAISGPSGLACAGVPGCM